MVPATAPGLLSSLIIKAGRNPDIEGGVPDHHTRPDTTQQRVRAGIAQHVNSINSPPEETTNLHSEREDEDEQNIAVRGRHGQSRLRGDNRHHFGKSTGSIICRGMPRHHKEMW